MVSPQNNIWETGLKIVTAIVANATNSFSLATKNSGLVAMLATRFRYDLYLNPLRILQVSVQTDFKSNDDLKKIVFKKLFHMFSS